MRGSSSGFVKQVSKIIVRKISSKRNLQYVGKLGKEIQHFKAQAIQILVFCKIVEHCVVGDQHNEDI